MMICEKCGALYEDDEVPTFEDDFGYETGVGFKSCKQSFIGNCHCGGELVKAERCENCGEWKPEINLGLCDDCIAAIPVEESEIKTNIRSETSLKLLYKDIFEQMNDEFTKEMEAQNDKKNVN